MAKKIIALFLLVITLFSCLVLPASAATTSSGTSTRTITVVTKGNWSYPGSESITLKQTKGTFTYTKWNEKTATKSIYGTWKITVAATDGTHTYSKTWNNGSIKLTLKANKTYKITIAYNSYVDTINQVSYSNFCWKTRPSWKVSSTWKVSSYY